MKPRGAIQIHKNVDKLYNELLTKIVRTTEEFNKLCTTDGYENVCASTSTLNAVQSAVDVLQNWLDDTVCNLGQ